MLNHLLTLAEIETIDPPKCSLGDMKLPSIVRSIDWSRTIERSIERERERERVNSFQEVQKRKRVTFKYFIHTNSNVSKESCKMWKIQWWNFLLSSYKNQMKETYESFKFHFFTPKNFHKVKILTMTFLKSHYCPYFLWIFDACEFYHIHSNSIFI